MTQIISFKPKVAATDVLRRNKELFLGSELKRDSNSHFLTLGSFLYAITPSVLFDQVEIQRSKQK